MHTFIEDGIDTAPSIHDRTPFDNGRDFAPTRDIGITKISVSMFL
jgi:hypothetical protein